VTNAPTNQAAATPANGNEVVLIFRDEKTANPQGRVVHLRNVSPDLLARLAQEEKQQTARAPQPSIPPSGLTPTANPSGASGTGANLLPNAGGLRRDVTAPPVSFNR